MFQEDTSAWQTFSYEKRFYVKIFNKILRSPQDDDSI